MTHSLDEIVAAYTATIEDVLAERRWLGMMATAQPDRAEVGSMSMQADGGP